MRLKISAAVFIAAIALPLSLLPILGRLSRLAPATGVVVPTVAHDEAVPSSGSPNVQRSVKDDDKEDAFLVRRSDGSFHQVTTPGLLYYRVPGDSILDACRVARVASGKFVDAESSQASNIIPVAARIEDDIYIPAAESQGRNPVWEPLAGFFFDLLGPDGAPSRSVTIAVSKVPTLGPIMGHPGVNGVDAVVGIVGSPAIVRSVDIPQGAAVYLRADDTSWTCMQPSQLAPGYHLIRLQPGGSLYVDYDFPAGVRGMEMRVNYAQRAELGSFRVRPEVGRPTEISGLPVGLIQVTLGFPNCTPAQAVCLERSVIEPGLTTRITLVGNSQEPPPGILFGTLAFDPSWDKTRALSMAVGIKFLHEASPHNSARQSGFGEALTIAVRSMKWGSESSLQWAWETPPIPAGDYRIVVVPLGHQAQVTCTPSGASFCQILIPPMKLGSIRFMDEETGTFVMPEHISVYCDPEDAGLQRVLLPVDRQEGQSPRVTFGVVSEKITINVRDSRYGHFEVQREVAHDSEEIEILVGESTWVTLESHSRGGPVEMTPEWWLGVRFLNNDGDPATVLRRSFPIRSTIAKPAESSTSLGRAGESKVDAKSGLCRMRVCVRGRGSLRVEFAASESLGARAIITVPPTEVGQEGERVVQLLVDDK
jgi:hypothetical protein